MLDVVVGSRNPVRIFSSIANLLWCMQYLPIKCPLLLSLTMYKVVLPMNLFLLSAADDRTRGKLLR